MFSRNILYCVFFSIAVLITTKSVAQKKIDTLLVSGNPSDSSTKRLLKQDTSANKFNPRIASLRSALIPGWGQAYNKKYWKIPIIYGALGVTAGIFIYDLKTYKLLRLAVIYRTDGIPADADKVDAQFKTLQTESIRSYRNSFRQNVDYAALFFIAFWGINVVDATVDAHMKSFDVNDNISFKFKPGFDNATRNSTIGISFNIHERHQRTYSIH